MVSCKFCYQETFCVFIYGERVYILSYTYVLHVKIYLTSTFINFMKSRWKALEAMNVLNLSVNVNIALASYVIKQLKCRGRRLSDPLKLDQNYKVLP